MSFFFSSFAVLFEIQKKMKKEKKGIVVIEESSLVIKSKDT
jgi:hypothetical protein